MVNTMLFVSSVSTTGGRLLSTNMPLKTSDARRQCFPFSNSGQDTVKLGHIARSWPKSIS